MAVKVIIKKTLKDIACTVLWRKAHIMLSCYSQSARRKNTFQNYILASCCFFVVFFNVPETLFSASLSFAHSNLEIFPFFILVSQMEEPLSKLYIYIL